MFLHPSILILGAAAATLPVLIHWLTRPRPQRLPLSTIRFVREAIEQRRARHWLRDILVLAVRSAAVLLLAAAIARPLFRQREQTAAGEAPASTVRVLFVDLSQSMAAETGGVVALERARPLASRQLEFRPGLRTNLILAAAQPHAVFAGPSTNFVALRESLAQTKVRPERLQVQAALNMAADMLAAADTPQTRRELVIVSDFQRTNWAAADFSALPEGTVIELQSVAPEQAAGNVAVLHVSATGRAVAGQEQRLEVLVGNFAPAPRNVKVEVRLGDAAYQLAGACAPFSTATLTTMVRSATSGWHTGEARLVGVEDALSADDVRPCVLEVPPPPVYLLITRQPDQQRPSSSYYLQRALASEETSSHVQRLAPDQLDNQSLAAADLIALDHPGKLSAEAIGALASLARRGRGLLYVAADATDATNLKMLVDALGGSLRIPVEFQPPTATSARRDLFLTNIRRQQSPFAVLGDELASLAGPLRFSGGLPSRRIPAGLEDDIRAGLSDGSAFLVVTASDAGMLAVMNADLERSNLPVSPLFVPLVSELTQELLGRRCVAGELLSGEPFAVALPAAGDAAEGLTLHGGPADLAEGRGELLLESTGPLWRSAAAGPPGVYEIKRSDQTVAAAAVVIPEEESDLRTLPADVLEIRLSGKRDVRFHAWAPEASERQDSLWVWLAVGCLACLLGEFALLRWFRT
jgi:Aerotolerance regulator N-terminal/von Willebrand factor type A domain